MTPSQNKNTTTRKRAPKKKKAPAKSPPIRVERTGQIAWGDEVLGIREPNAAIRADSSLEDYHGRYRRRARTIQVPTTPTRTKQFSALEKDTQKWLRHYFPGIYRQPFGMVHDEIIEVVDYCIDSGRRGAVAAPRGTGKSYILSGVALKAVCEGRVRFPVVLPWDSKQLKKILGFWKKALCFNTTFASGYPAICAPFVESRGSSQKISTFINGDGKPLGAHILISEGMIVLPYSIGVIGGSTINGNPLGLHHTTDTGEGLRPDLVLIDDPQDRDTAMSRLQIRSTIQQIDFDIAGMCGPDTSMPMLLACTVKQVDDVADHYLNDPEWHAVRVAQIVEWPKNMDAWEKWNAARLAGETKRDGGRKARAYYKKHKTELIEGMVVSWKERYRRKSANQVAEPDALYSAMNDYFSMGHDAFSAERQNQPQKTDTTVYDLTPDMVAGCVYRGRHRCDLPADAVVIAAATDINHYGLHSAAIGFANDQTAACVWYDRHEREKGAGIVPKNCPEQEAKRLVYDALCAHSQTITQMPLSRDGAAAAVGLWLIDGGYMPDVVRRFIEGPGRTCGVTVVMARGSAAEKYRPTGMNVIGTPREQTHQSESTVSGRFCAFSADYWREIAQRSWLGKPGSPGGLSLYEGRHTAFAEQVCGDRLLEKVQGTYGPIWRWVRVPGTWNDWGDAVTMCYVGAVWQGVGTQGMVQRPQQYVERRKCKMPVQA